MGATRSQRAKVIDDYQGLIAESESLHDRATRRDALMAAAHVLEHLPISDDLEQNRRTLSHLFEGASDWVLRPFRLPDEREAIVTYIEGLVDKESLDDHVLSPLMRYGGMLSPAGPGDSSPDGMIDHLKLRVLEDSQLKITTSIRELVDGLLHGDTGLLVQGETRGLVISWRAYEKRDVDEPETESVIRGPREGFVEHLRSNTALLRRRLRTHQLKLEPVRVGRLSRTDVVVCYIQGLASPEIVTEAKRRLARIDIDGIIDSTMIEELIEDDPYSPFPQAIPTERPDIVAASLLEGRIAILVDGSPFALIVPATLWSLLQASEDYYERYYIGTFLRGLRYALALVALLGPALYVAITTFHQEMLPTQLLLTVAATREGIPFPSVVEALMMEMMFEALREAGVRLPRNVGQAVSIVGALVIGQAAVQAGLVSAPMVIIVAITGIASFTFPRFNLGVTVRLLRFPMMFLASTFGLYGIVIGVLAIMIHVASLRSFGVPYAAPVGPLVPPALRDIVIRPPTWWRARRPPATGYLNLERQGRRIKSGPEPWEKEGD